MGPRLEITPSLPNLPFMPTALKGETARPTRRPKPATNGRPPGSAALHAKPTEILSAGETTTKAKLRRRLADQRDECWLSMDDFRRKAGLR